VWSPPKKHDDTTVQANSLQGIKAREAAITDRRIAANVTGFTT
jgi:hypothetical protein